MSIKTLGEQVFVLRHVHTCPSWHPNNAEQQRHEQYCTDVNTKNKLLINNCLIVDVIKS